MKEILRCNTTIRRWSEECYKAAVSASNLSCVLQLVWTWKREKANVGSMLVQHLRCLASIDPTLGWNLLVREIIRRSQQCSGWLARYDVHYQTLSLCRSGRYHSLVALQNHWPDGSRLDVMLVIITGYNHPVLNKYLNRFKWILSTTM